MGYYNPDYIDDAYFEEVPSISGSIGGYYDPGYINEGYFEDIPGLRHLMFYSALHGQWSGVPNGVFDLDSDVMKVSAHTMGYASNLDIDDFWDDTTDEVAGGNYVSGGAVIPGITVSLASGTVTFDAGDVIWQRSPTGFTSARKFVIYRSTGDPATSRLFSVILMDNDVGNAACDLVLRGA